MPRSGVRIAPASAARDPGPARDCSYYAKPWRLANRGAFRLRRGRRRALSAAQPIVREWLSMGGGGCLGRSIVKTHPLPGRSRTCRAPAIAFTAFAQMARPSPRPADRDGTPLDAREGQDRDVQGVPHLVREVAEARRPLVGDRALAKLCERGDGTGDGVVEAQVEGLKILRGDRLLLREGKPGDDLTDVPVVVDDLRHGDPATEEIVAVPSGAQLDLLVVDVPVRGRYAGDRPRGPDRGTLARPNALAEACPCETWLSLSRYP